MSLPNFIVITLLMVYSVSVLQVLVPGPLFNKARLGVCKTFSTHCSVFAAGNLRCCRRDLCGDKVLVAAVHSSMERTHHPGAITGGGGASADRPYSRSMAGD